VAGLEAVGGGWGKGGGGKRGSEFLSLAEAIHPRRSAAGHGPPSSNDHSQTSALAAMVQPARTTTQTAAPPAMAYPRDRPLGPQQPQAMIRNPRRTVPTTVRNSNRAHAPRRHQPSTEPRDEPRAPQHLRTSLRQTRSRTMVYHLRYRVRYRLPPCRRVPERGRSRDGYLT